MDEISQGPDKQRRLPKAPRWLAAAAIAGLVATALVVTVTRSAGQHAAGQHAAARGSTPAATAPPAVPPGPVPTVPPPPGPGVPQPAAAGSILLVCGSASPVLLTPYWQAGSVQARTPTLVIVRSTGNVRPGRANGAGRTSPGHAARSPAAIPASCSEIRLSWATPRPAS